MANRLMLHKIMLICIKYFPYLLCLLYLINSILSALGIILFSFSLIGYVSLLPFIFILMTSFVFNFCIFHRLPLYYIICDDVISYLLYANILSITVSCFLLIQLVLLGILILCAVYFKDEQNKITKEFATTTN